jgi:predicted DNA-binding transcriptional regulator AlpA
VNLNHFPAKHNINSSLVAFVESNLVGIRESINLLVRGPVLYSSIGS